MRCINCGAGNVKREDDNFTCERCDYRWDVAFEAENAAYIRSSHGREPAESVFAVSAEPANPVDLDKMTIPELKVYAEGRNYDLGGATKKYDIIAVIRQKEAGDATPVD